METSVLKLLNKIGKYVKYCNFYLVSKRRTSNIDSEKVNACTAFNAGRHPQGRRYDRDHLLHCIHIKETCGRSGYQNIKMNSHDGRPSIHTLIQHSMKIRKPISEGRLMAKELKVYLLSHNLDMVVTLSEDATNVNGRIDYTARTNQIVGYVPPMYEGTCMPVPESYAATSAAVIESICLIEKLPISSAANVVMAQPLDLKAKPFCILIYGGAGKFSKQSVRNRWTYIVEELTKEGIRVISVASDSDPRYNGAMRDILMSCRTTQLSQGKKYNLPAWFHFDLSMVLFMIWQDTIHNATKLRNRLLSKKCNLQFGQHKITVEHLRYLLNISEKGELNLCKTDLDPTDRQNFESVMKICSREVIELLQAKVEGSEGLVMYLKFIDNVVRPFQDWSLTPTERLAKLWHANFTQRIWRNNVLKQTDQHMQINFITTFTYVCIEVNAHSLVSVMLKLKEDKEEKFFLPHLFSSQACEAFFRKIRSLTVIGSSMPDMSMLDFINRCEKVVLVDEIETTQKDYIYSNDSKRCRDYYYNTNISHRYQNQTLPELDEIIAVIERAKMEAIEDATKLGIQVDPAWVEQCTIGPTKPSEDESPPTAVSRRDDMTFQTINGRNFKDYSKSIKDVTAVNEKSSFCPVQKTDNILDGLLFVKKRRLVKVMTDNRNKLSSDRTRRVRQKPKQTQPEEPRQAAALPDPKSTQRRCTDTRNSDPDYTASDSDESYDEFD